MDRAGVGKVCLALPSATLDHPFGGDHDAYRVGGKMFCMVGAMGGISFKVSDIAYEVLTEDGRARPAPYLAKNPGGYCGIGGTGVTCPIGVGVDA